CTSPPVNPLRKKLHFPPLRVNHNANAIANAPQPSRIEVSSPPSTSQQKSASTEPTLPPCRLPNPTTTSSRLNRLHPLLTTPLPRNRRDTYAPVLLQSITPHPYAHAYHQHTRPQQLSILSPISTNNFAPIATVQGQSLSTGPSPGCPLQSLFDHTCFCILRDISHLQTSFYAVLHNERREKGNYAYPDDEHEKRKGFGF
ncbi:hypothetical protein K435DRAFT_969935, partial [Dendrothele bispora CBS 962.96]